MKIDKTTRIIKEFALRLNCKEYDYRNGSIYRLPEENGDSWFIEVEPDDGLLLSDAYFSLLKPVTYVYNIPENHILICSLYSGNITIVENGKKAKRLYQGMHFFVTSGKQIKIIINTDEPVWYTLALVFEDFIKKYIKDFSSQPSYILSKDIILKTNHFNTPELLMIFEQLKYAIRNCDLPHMYLYR